MNVENSLSARPAEISHTVSRETRVAIIFHRFGPYHHARLNAAGQVMTVWGIEACGREELYAWEQFDGARNFQRVTLTDHDSGDRRWRQELRRKTWQTLDKIKPQAVVIPGWIFAEALSGLEWCVSTNTPAVVMSESTEWDESRRVWKEYVKRRLIGMCSAGLVGGRPHADYLARLGMPQSHIFQGYDGVDNHYFAREAQAVRKQGPEIHSRFNLPRNFFLASARFIEKKNLFGLLAAYAKYRQLADPAQIFDLVLLGDGALRPALEKFRSEQNLDHSVHLPGFKQYGELPTYYALAKVFIHPSTTEQWGLVVNEAMASGLPVLVSNRCGCAQDLVQEGVNGFSFDPNNHGQLAGLMQKVSAVGFPLTQQGDESQRIISQWGAERFGSSLMQSVAAALAAPRPKSGLVDRWLLRGLARSQRA